MSTATDHADTDAHAPDYIERAEAKRFYIFFDICLMLAAVTLAEWILATLPFAFWVLAIPLGVLSVLKFAAVVAWFMHLRWDHKLCTVIFVTGLFIAGATCVALLAIFETPEKPAETSVEP